MNLEYLATALRNTGLSIVYPSAPVGPPARGKLIHRWIDGELIYQREVGIAPNGQFIGLISELIPPVQKLSFPSVGILGSLEITFDRDVYVTALRLNLDDIEESFSGRIPE